MPLMTILAPYDGTAQDDDALRLTCDAVRGTGGRVVVLAVTPAPSSLPLRALPAEFDAAADEALDRTEDVARLQGIPIEGRLMRARDVAEAIVAEAREIGADAIYMALCHHRHPWGKRQLWRTGRAVERHAPCRVVLDSSREAGAQDAAAVLSLETYRAVRHAQ